MGSRINVMHHVVREPGWRGSGSSAEASTSACERNTVSASQSRVAAGTAHIGQMSMKPGEYTPVASK
jgi:hypothetical protein